MRKNTVWVFTTQKNTKFNVLPVSGFRMLPTVDKHEIFDEISALYFINLFLLQQIFNYSRAAPKGQEFMKRLSNITTLSTLFVPDNNGLYENQVISLSLYHTGIYFLYNTKIH